jgi:hypothetical protein
MHPILARPRFLALYLVPWLAAGAVAAAFALPAAQGRLAAFALALPLAVLFAFVGLGAWYPCRAAPLTEAGLLRLVATHLAAALLSSGLWVGAGEGLAHLLSRLPATPEAASLFAGRRPLLFGIGLLLYLLAAAVHYLLIALAERQAALARALELRMAAREAELSALKAQLDPHFLFNSLNALASLAGSDAAAARAMAVALADFFRRSRAAAAAKAISLGEELALTGAYLEVEKARFGDRLAVEERIEDQVLRWSVPPLLLQPLVENAVRHGIAPRVAGGEVRIEAGLAAGRLCLAVENPRDPGASPPRPAGRGPALGLANVERRLRLTYGGEATFAVRAEPDRFRVEIELPRQELPGQEKAAEALPT